MQVTVSNAPDTAQELHAVLEDLRLHLLWQQEEGGRLLLLEPQQAAALRSTSSSFAALVRSRAQQPVAAAPSAPAAPAPRAASAPLPAEPPQPPARTLPPRPAPEPLAARPAPAPEPARAVAPRAEAPGMLFDVPQAGRTAPGALPGSVNGERPTLDQIRRELGDCRRCKLCEGRKNIVFGSGNPRTQLVFVGEGPGEQEDLSGMPFVGPAGELLTKMIEAMGFRRDDVYICNVVKCRPPGNRNPEPDEVSACEPFLRAQLAAIQPRVIVALGKFAAQTLLRDKTPISQLRGNWREYEGIQLMPTFHPAYLLRNPADKRKAWEDLQQVMKVFGKQPAGRRS